VTNVTVDQTVVLHVMYRRARPIIYSRRRHSLDGKVGVSEMRRITNLAGLVACCGCSAWFSPFPAFLSETTVSYCAYCKAKV
jgi:hypothetical protein